VKGSTTLFAALYDRMLASNKMAIARMTPRANTSPRFCALLPQVRMLNLFFVEAGRIREIAKNWANLGLKKGCFSCFSRFPRILPSSLAWFYYLFFGFYLEVIQKQLETYQALVALQTLAPFEVC
jgi:hypothetical protein